MTLSEIPEPVIFTDDAAKKVKELMDDEDNRGMLHLRIAVEGGGCSGLKYQFSFDSEINESDKVVEKTVEDHTVKLVIDPISIQYLLGAKIDYKVDLEGGERFVISNPNATTSCGCGSSFATE